MRQLIFLLMLLFGMTTVWAQGLPTDGPLTVRPMLQQLGERLLKGKTGSIVAINPENGEIICLATNTPQDIVGETKLRQVKTRVNQNVFRQIVLANYEWKCALTGIDPLGVDNN